MSFYNRSNPPPSRSAPHGRRERERKQLYIDSNGNKSLKVVETFDQYEVIQSYAEETRIENILNRYAHGDVSALQKSPAVYLDATGMPRNLAEAYEVLRKAEEVYNSFDADYRRSVGSYHEWLGSYSNLETLVAALNPSVTETPTEGGDLNA